MNEAEIRKYGELMRELGLTGLEITDDKNRVRLERMATVTKEQDCLATVPVPEKRRRRQKAASV